MTFSEIQLTGFSMMRAFTERCLQADFHFTLNVNVDVSVASYINSDSSEMKLHFLQQWIDLIISRTMKSESTRKATLFKQIHRSCFFFFYVFLKHKRDMRLIYILIVFIFFADTPSSAFLSKDIHRNKSF